MSQTTTSFGQADTSQDPAEFAAILSGKKEVTPPPKDSAAENLEKPEQANGKPAANEHLQDNAVTTADEPKPGAKEIPDTTKPSTEDNNQATPPVTSSTDEQRHRDAARMIQQKSEERKRAALALVEVVKSDPNHLLTVAKYDKKLADEAAKEAFGYNSLEEFQDAQRITEIREKDPERAVLEERLIKLERQETNRETALKDSLKTKFLESKGIPNNQFDDKYVAVEEKLALLDPKFVEEKYVDALAIAFQLANPSAPTVDTQKVELQNALNKQGESSGGGSILQPHAGSSEYSEAQVGFASVVGVSLT